MMIQDVIAFLVGMIGLAISCTAMILTFPGKRSLRFTICMFVLFATGFYAAAFIFGEIIPGNGFLTGLAYFPIMIWLFQGKLFQKTFAFFFQFLALFLQVTLATLIGGAFSGDGSSEFVAYTASLMLMHTVYLVWMWGYGRHVFKRLFASGRSVEWAIYSVVAIFSFAVLSVTKIAPGSVVQTGLVLIFIGLSFGILCFAIINTHEKTKQKYEADMAREIVSSGRGYYDKLTEMTEQLHILRHDYKLHLTSMQKLLDDGHGADVKEYLAKLNEKTSGAAIHAYCDNRILNALLDSFAERCEKENISFTVKIVLPPKETIDDYELCVIIGNLLENAITACVRTPKDKRRYIELSMRSREEQYGIKVENSYDGVLKHEGRELYSTKKDGGMGINSIKSVVNRYNGEYVPVWDESKFGTFVVLKLDDE